MYIIRKKFMAKYFLEMWQRSFYFYFLKSFRDSTIKNFTEPKALLVSSQLNLNWPIPPPQTTTKINAIDKSHFYRTIPPLMPHPLIYKHLLGIPHFYNEVHKIQKEKLEK